MRGEQSAEVKYLLLSIGNSIVVSAIPIQKNGKIFAVRLASFSETMYAYREKTYKKNIYSEKTAAWSGRVGNERSGTCSGNDIFVRWKCSAVQTYHADFFYGIREDAFSVI